MRQKPTPVQNTVLHSSVGKSTVGNLKPCKSMQHPRKRPSMTNEETKTYFLHYPKLVVPTQGIDLLGGRLGSSASQTLSPWIGIGRTILCFGKPNLQFGVAYFQIASCHP